MVFARIKKHRWRELWPLRCWFIPRVGPKRWHPFSISFGIQILYYCIHKRNSNQRNLWKYGYVIFVEFSRQLILTNAELTSYSLGPVFSASIWHWGYLCPDGRCSSSGISGSFVTQLVMKQWRTNIFHWLWRWNLSGYIYICIQNRYSVYDVYIYIASIVPSCEEDTLSKAISCWCLMLNMSPFVDAIPLADSRMPKRILRWEGLCNDLFTMEQEQRW